MNYKPEKYPLIKVVPAWRLEGQEEKIIKGSSIILKNFKFIYRLPSANCKTTIILRRKSINL